MNAGLIEEQEKTCWSRATKARSANIRTEQHDEGVADRVVRTPRVVVGRGAEDVFLRVDEQQRGLVTDLRQGAEGDAGEQATPAPSAGLQHVYRAPDDPVQAGPVPCGYAPVGHTNPCILG